MNKYISEANFVYCKNFISPEQARELAKEFIQFCNENNVQGDTQISESSACYNYISFLELLCQKTPEVSKFLGEPVLPTYSYARVYKEGATLERHRDRDACEVSFTLNLSQDEDWPIWIEKPNGEEVSLSLETGDAMMYLGCRAEHWREKFKGKEYVQVFLHYVRSRGDKAYAYFDRTRDKDKADIHGHPASTNNEVKKEQKAEAPVVSYTDNHVSTLKEYIVVFEDIVPIDLCDRIIKEYGKQDLDPLYIGGGLVDKTVRNATGLGISLPAIINQNQETRLSIDRDLFTVASKVIQQYSKLFPHCGIQEDSGYELLRYDEGNFYREHTDNFKANPRSVSCSMALNDDYEGGEFSFFQQKLNYRLKKGSIIMFPSNFMYPHQILPVTKGTRYSIITWFI